MWIHANSVCVRHSEMPSACNVMASSPLGKEAQSPRGCHEGSLTQETGKQRNSYKVRVGAFSAISVLFESRWVMWSCCLSALLSLGHHFLLFFPSLSFFFFFYTELEAKKKKKSFFPQNNLHKIAKNTPTSCKVEDQITGRNIILFDFLFFFFLFFLICSHSRLGKSVKVFCCVKAVIWGVRASLPIISISSFFPG